jgi:hypothetical protein
MARFGRSFPIRAHLSQQPLPAVVTGSAAVTLAGVTASGVGTLGVKGTAASTLANATASATGVVAVTGTAAVSLAAATATATGTVTLNATAAVTLAAVTAAATGIVAVTGTSAVTLAAATAVAAGKIGETGTAAPVLGNATSAASVGVGANAAATVTLAGVTANATGTFSLSTVTGTAAVTLDSLIAAANGHAAILAHVFTPPLVASNDKAAVSAQEAIEQRLSRQGRRLAAHYRAAPRAATVLRVNGAYITIEGPTTDDLATATEIYPGGRSTDVDDNTKTQLVAAGFAVTDEYR